MTPISLYSDTLILWRDGVVDTLSDQSRVVSFAGLPAILESNDDAITILPEFLPDLPPQVAGLGLAPSPLPFSLILGDNGDNFLGEDTVFGDVVFSDGIDNIIYGYGGTDWISGDGAGLGSADVTNGGNDMIYGGSGPGFMAGEALGAFNYALSIDGGADFIVGGADADVMAGEALALNGPEATSYNGGNDTIYGEGGADTMAGDVVMLGDLGSAEGDGTVFGGGSDMLWGGGGDDVMAGDTLVVGYGSAVSKKGGDDFMAGGLGNDTMAGDALNMGFGTAASERGGDDTLLGGDGDDLIFGDTNGIDQDGGDDVLYGGDGADSIYGGDGDDLFDGGTGIDWIVAGSGDDGVIFDAEDHNADVLGSVDGGSGYDILFFDLLPANDAEDGVLDGMADFSGLADVWSGFERIELTDSAGDDAIALSAADILSITGDGILEIAGDAGDKVQLHGVSSWDWEHQASAGGFSTYISDFGIAVSIEDDITVLLNTTG